MIKKISLILALGFLSGGCSHTEITSPCTYDNRNGCGPVVHLQQVKAL